MLDVVPIYGISRLAAVIIIKLPVTICFSLLTAGMAETHGSWHFGWLQASIPSAAQGHVASLSMWSVSSKMLPLLQSCPCYKVITVCLLHIPVTLHDERCIDV